MKDLSLRVLETAVKDYKSVCAGTKEIIRVDGLLMIRSMAKVQLERFFKDGGAEFYLELSGAQMDASAMFRALRREINYNGKSNTDANN